MPLVTSTESVGSLGDGGDVWDAVDEVERERCTRGAAIEFEMLPNSSGGL